MDSFIPLDKNFSESTFQNCTLILPSVSIGNVGQLACDALVSTFGFKKAGYFSPEYFLPLVGYNAFATSLNNKFELTMNSEVFFSKDLKIVLLQFRSPLIKKLEESFCSNLLTWVKSCEISRVIMLTSCHSYERRDIQINSSPLRFLLSSPSSDDLRSKLEDDLKWKKLEKRTEENEDEIFLPGAGFAKSLYMESLKTSTEMLVLMIFCSEGDNTSEAIFIINQLNNLLNMKDKTEVLKWSVPSSWTGFYGSNPPIGIF